MAQDWVADVLGEPFEQLTLDLGEDDRSIRPGQTPGYIADLTTYDEDIAAALIAMGCPGDGAPTRRRMVLVGHSTGGLTLSIWASSHPDAAAALILNSPWLAFQLGAVRGAVAPVVELQSRLRPLGTFPQVDMGFSARAALKLGDSVTVERIPGALHDVFLSRREARDIAYERMDRWVMGSLGTTRLPLAPGSYD